MSATEQVEPAERGPLAVETDERSARADWRSSLVGTAGVTVLIGAWLMASALVLDYDRPAIAVIWGAAILVIGLLRLVVAPSSVWLAMASAAAGALAALTAFVADDTAGPTANVALMGGAVVVLAFIALAASGESRRGSRP